MPSFDIVSKTDLAEVDNAINSAMRELLQGMILKIVNQKSQENPTKLN